jgi:hypothetical protein
VQSQAPSTKPMIRPAPHIFSCILDLSSIRPPPCHLRGQM